MAFSLRLLSHPVMVLEFVDKQLITILSDQRRELREAINQSEERTAQLITSELGKVYIILDEIKVQVKKTNGTVGNHEYRLNAFDRAFGWLENKVGRVVRKQDKEAITWRSAGRWLWENFLKILVIGFVLFMFFYWLASNNQAFESFLKLIKFMR